MWGKKGDLALPLYLSLALAALVVILFIFGIFFLVIGVTQNPNLQIKSEAYQDSSKLLTILKSTTNAQIDNVNLTIAELISLANKNENYKEKLTQELSYLLTKLPKPKENSRWNTIIYVGDKTFLELAEEVILGNKHLKQSIKIPLENKELAEVNLYLNCFSCSEEEINNVA